jgi:hypothetical protein
LTITTAGAMDLSDPSAVSANAIVAGIGHRMTFARVR